LLAILHFPVEISLQGNGIEIKHNAVFPLRHGFYVIEINDANKRMLWFGQTPELMKFANAFKSMKVGSCHMLS
jgi:hypothetical protein